MDNLHLSPSGDCNQAFCYNDSKRLCNLRLHETARLAGAIAKFWQQLERNKEEAELRNVQRQCDFCRRLCLSQRRFQPGAAARAVCRLQRPHPCPAQIALQMLGCDVVEAVKPLFELAAVGVDIQDVEHDLAHRFALAGDDERAIRRAQRL